MFKQYKFLGFPSQLLLPECKDLVELFFEMRGFYHELYHPDKDSKPSYPSDYDGLRQLTHQIQEERSRVQDEQRKKKAATRKVCAPFLPCFLCMLTKIVSQSVKSKALIESDDEIEVITGNEAHNPIEGDASDKVYLEAFSKGLMKVLTKALAQMQVDDEERPAHDIGTVPKSLHFKKVKVNHECAHEDHPEASCPSAQVILPFYHPVTSSNCLFHRRPLPRLPKARRMIRNANSVRMMTPHSSLQVTNFTSTFSSHF